MRSAVHRADAHAHAGRAADDHERGSFGAATFDCIEEVLARPASIAPPPATRQSVSSRVCVGNMSKGKTGSGPTPFGFSDVRVDRQTAFGNPFPMGEGGRDKSLRAAVCEAHNEMLTDPREADVAAIGRRHGLRVDVRFVTSKGRDVQAQLADALAELEARLRAGLRASRLTALTAGARGPTAGRVALSERARQAASGSLRVTPTCQRAVWPTAGRLDSMSL